MSMYTSLVANVLFPLQETYKKHNTVQIRKAMEDSQWWSPNKLEVLRVERLRRLLSLAGAHVPYYGELFSQIGFRPEDLSTISDLQQLPLLTKSVIRGEGERMKSQVAQGLARFNTGGSSGEPLIFFIGHERVSHDVAAKWRATRWWNVDIGDRELVVWGSPIELTSQDRIREIRDRLMRTELLPAFEMSEQKLDEFVERIRSRRPRMLFGYPSAITLIATHAKKRGVRLDRLGIKVVFVTSERLYDYQQAAISQTFGCAVANGYGGRDAGFIAHACPEGGMHITAEDIIVEIIDEQGRVQSPGRQGEIVVTHLATPDFPFVRYRTGDIGVLGTKRCSCGRGLPLLEGIQGRSTDFVVAADGTIMHGLSLIYILRDLPSVGSFKIIQESLRLTHVQVVPAAGYDNSVAGRIRNGLQARLGQEVEIRIDVLDAIPAEKSGKHRYVVSHVSR